MITPRCAEVLLYLQSLGRGWVFPDPAAMRQALGYKSRVGVWKQIDALRDVGAVESRKAKGKFGGHKYRVLIPVSEWKIGRRWGRPKGTPNRWRGTNTKIPYCGCERHS